MAAPAPSPAEPAPAEPASPAPEPENDEEGVVPESIQGLWHEYDALGSGWGEVWLLYSDGRYTWHSGGACASDEILERSGRYEVAGDALVFHEEKQKVRRGATVTESEVHACNVEGGEVVEIVHPEPPVARLPKGECPEKLQTPMHACMTLQGKPFFRFASGDEQIREYYYR